MKPPVSHYTRASARHAKEQSEFVWTVDEYTDAIRKRYRKVVDEERQTNERKWPGVPMPYTCFDNEREAVVFIIDRHYREICKLEKQLKSSNTKMRRWDKRLDAIDREAR